MKVRFGRSCVISAVAAVSVVSSLHAADLRWDADGTAGSFGTDGTGIWDLVTPNWNNVPATTNSVWVQGSNAVFGDPANSPTVSLNSYNVSVNDEIVVNDIQLNTAANGGNYNFDAPNNNSLTLNGNIYKNTAAGPVRFDLLGGPLTLGAGIHTIALRDTGGAADPEMAINANIGGNGGLTLDNRLAQAGVKESWGTLASTGINTYKGLTSIKYGRLVISQSAGLGDTVAGTVISEAGTLSVGGPGTTGVSNLTISEPITISRSIYTGGDATDGGAFSHYGAAIITENGTGNTTFNGPFVVDSNDARIAAFTGTATITSNITAGPNATLPMLSVTGDFAGFVHLTGNNVALTGGVTIVSSVELNVDADSQIGGASTPLNLTGGGTYHPVGGYATSFGTHVINNSTFNGGIDVDDTKSFTITQPLGSDSVAAGSIGKRGLGTLNLNSVINLRGGQTFWDAGFVNVNNTVTLSSLHLRSPVVTIASGGIVTLTGGYNSFGQDTKGTNGGPDIAVLNITGNGQLIQTNGDDFNVSDNPNTQGTIFLKDTGVLTTGGIVALGKQPGAKGTITQSGGTLTSGRNGNFSFVVGRDNGTGVYNLSGGTFASPGEVYVGQGFGDGVTGSGQWNQSGGTATISNWFVVGREGGKGDVDISGGTFIKAGGGNTPIGEGGNGTRTNSFTVRGTGTADFQTGEVWVSNGNTAVTMTIQDSAIVNGHDFFVVGRFGNSNGTLNFAGGALNHGGNNPFIVAAGGGSIGLVTQTGGVYTDTSSSASGGTWISDGGTATYNLSGGSLNTALLDVGHNGGDNGTLTVSGTGAVVADHIRIGEAGSVNGTLNLSGGSVTSPLIEARNSSGAKTFNFTGGTLSAGSFNVGAGLTNTGTGRLAPGKVGAVGATAITGTYTQGATAFMSIDLASASSFDTVTVSGAATIGGTLNLALLGGYDPTKLVGHTVLSASAVTGKFAKVGGVLIGPAKGLAVTYTATSVKVTAARLGDADLSGVVNFDDLLVLAQDYNKPTDQTWTTGDFNGDGAVGFDDLLALAQNYNLGALTALPSNTSAQFASDWALAQSIVPEPTSIALLGLIGVVGGRRRR